MSTIGIRCNKFQLPMVESDDGSFLITAFPSRKATRKYLENDDER